MTPLSQQQRCSDSTRHGSTIHAFFFLIIYFNYEQFQSPESWQEKNQTPLVRQCDESRRKPGTTEGTRSYWKHCAFINEALPSTTHSTSLISLRGSFFPCRYIWFIEAETEGTLKKEGHIPVPFLKAAWAENWDSSSPSFISSFSNAQPPEQLLKRLRV